MDSYSPSGTQNRIHFQFDSGNSHDLFQGTFDQAPHTQGFIYRGGTIGTVAPWDNDVTGNFDGLYSAPVNLGYIWNLGSDDLVDIGGTNHITSFDSEDIDIAEVLVWQSTLSQADYDLVTAYFGDKYGLSIVPEPATMVLLGLGAMLLRRRKA